jgi:hypothetical protein
MSKYEYQDVNRGRNGGAVIPLHAGTPSHDRGGINLPQCAWLYSLAVSDSHSDMGSGGSGLHVAHPEAFLAVPQLYGWDRASR